MDRKERLAVLPAGLQQASANTQWLAAHPEEARSHAGRWLCIVGERIAVAETDERVFQEKASQYAHLDGAYIVRIPTRDELNAAHPL